MVNKLLLDSKTNGTQDALINNLAVSGLRSFVLLIKVALNWNESAIKGQTIHSANRR
jgi:hypothetical protein